MVVFQRLIQIKQVERCIAAASHKMLSGASAGSLATRFRSVPSSNSYSHHANAMVNKVQVDNIRLFGCQSTSIIPVNCHALLQSPSPSMLWSPSRSYASKNKGGKGGKGKGSKKVQLTTDQLDGLVDMERVTGEMDKMLDDLKEKFIHEVTVRTSHGVFNNLTVKTPDGNFPLIQLAQVAQKSPQLVVINLVAAPQYISHVKEAFSNSGLNVNPQQDGTSLFVPIPKVTREHREGLVKSAKMLGEKSKKHLRELYSKHSKKIKNSKDGHSADDIRAADTMVQDLMHIKLKQIDEMLELKRQELMGGK